MRYSEEELQKLRDRWNKPLLKPGSFTRDENGMVILNDEYKDNPKAAEQPLQEKGWRWVNWGLAQIEELETFQDLLTTRLKQIEEVLIPKILKIDRKTDKYIREKTRDVWDKNAKNKFLLTIRELYECGLDKWKILIENNRELSRLGYNIDFRGADCSLGHFEGCDLSYSNFEYALFQTADFEGANCTGSDFEGAVCIGSIFHRTECYDAIFRIADCRGVKFNKAECENAIFNGANCNEASFETAKCKNANFESAKCQNSDFSFANCTNVNFTNADLKNTSFSNNFFLGVELTNAKVNDLTNIDEKILDHLLFESVYRDGKKTKRKKKSYEYYEQIRIRWKELTDTYNQLKKIYKANSYHAKAGNYYFWERYCRRKSYKGDKKVGLFMKVWEWFSEHSIGYGEKPWRLIWWMSGIIMAFGFVFFITNCIQNTNIETCTQWKPITSFYFSAVTFVTLGYGDYAPVTWWAQLLTVLESILGLSLLALFIVSIGRIIIRD